MKKSREVKPGRYCHYKGNIYDVLFLACHSETLEEYVVYRTIDKPYTYWIRPKTMFLESVTVNGTRIPRFRFMKP